MRRVVLPRDQEKSRFTSILEQVIKTTPGAEAAALVDDEGETVDYAGRIDTYELKVTAAHWLIVLSDIARRPSFGRVHQITVRARSRSYHVRQVHPGYAVVVVLHRHAAFAISERALKQCDADLAHEAGWPRPREDTRWCFVHVEAAREDRTRPVRVRVAGKWLPVEVLGCMVGLRTGEKGFRVRMPNGHETTLVRERLGRWFADERVFE